MTAKIDVDYDDRTGRFVITCPFFLNSLPKNLPNRKFDPKKKVWTAPAIRANVEFIKQKFGPSTCTITPAARFAIEDSLKKAKQNLDAARSQVKKFPPWYRYKTEPRKKQVEALEKVYGLEATALFMDMRTGKTKVIIDMVACLRMEDKVDRLLVLCPFSIRKNWGREIEIHSPIPMDVHLLDTGKPKSFDQWIGQKSDIKIMIVGIESIGPGSAIKYCERFLLSGLKTMVVIDEAHKIASHNKPRSQMIVALRTLARYRVAMTGTPIRNGPMDLFMMFEFLDPDIIGMGDFYSFRNAYAIMGGYVNDRGKETEIIGYQNLDELTEIVEPFIFQVRKDEVFPDAPKEVYVTREVALTARQREIYQAIKKEGRIESGNKTLVIQNVLEKMLRLQQVTSGIVAYANSEEAVKAGASKYQTELIEGANPKVEEMLDVIRETAPSPTIIWCAYVPEIQVVCQALRKEYGDDQVVELHGGIDEATRDLNVNVLFQGGKVRFLVANAATGAVGLTMSMAEVEIYMSNTFSYIDREQSKERAFGPNKKQGTLIVDIPATGTVDMHILAALAQKKDLAEYVRGTIDDLKERLYGD